MKKKLLVPYATYGNGHRAIAKYIEEYFNDQGEYEVLTIDLLQYSTPLLGWVSKQVAERIIIAKNPFIWNTIYWLFDSKIRSLGTNQIAAHLYNNRRIKKAIKDFDPDITISTHYFASTLIAYYNKKSIINTKLITIVTDYKAHQFWLKNHQAEAAIIVASKEARNDLIRKGIAKEKIKTFGIPVSDKYQIKYDKEAILKKYDLSGERPIFLFYGGGGNGTMLSIPYLKKIIKLNLNADFFFVSGNNTRLREKAEALVKESHSLNIKVMGFINNGPELLTVSDCVITKPGGITITECLCLKKPMLLVNKNAGQEKDNYKYLVRKGYAIKANSLFSFGKYLEYIIAKPEALTKMRKQLSKLDKNKAIEKTYRLANEILKK